jgi:hypothetical protein
MTLRRFVIRVVCDMDGGSEAEQWAFVDALQHRLEETAEVLEHYCPSAPCPPGMVYRIDVKQAQEEGPELLPE